MVTLDHDPRGFPKVDRGDLVGLGAHGGEHGGLPLDDDPRGPFPNVDPGDPSCLSRH